MLCLVGFADCGAQSTTGRRPEARAVREKDRARRFEAKPTRCDGQSSGLCSRVVAPGPGRHSSVAVDGEPAKDLESGEPTAAIDNQGVQTEGEAPLWVPIPIENRSDKALMHFYAALRRVENGEGQARITFYGASHVASDLFTGIVRQKLQSRFGESGPGFVMPAKPWKWYRHSGIRVERSRGWKTIRVEARAPKAERYGYAGVALESKDKYASGVIETRRNGGLKGVASRFELFYLKQPRGGHMVVFIDGKRMKRLSTEASHYETAYEIFEAPEAHHRFEIRTQGDGAVRVFGVAIERDTPGIILDTVGIPGARAANHLLWDDTIYREHLAKRTPDLIVLAYGTNEAGDDDVAIETYESELVNVMTRIREIAPQASCVLVGPSDRPLETEDKSYSPRPRTGLIIESQRRVAAEFSCGFFDLVAFMGGPMSMLRWVAADPPHGASDHVHYTLRGYKRLAEVFSQALIADYQPQEEKSRVNESTP